VSLYLLSRNVQNILNAIYKVVHKSVVIVSLNLEVGLEAFSSITVLFVTFVTGYTSFSPDHPVHPFRNIAR
jgi:hypothetical protein